MQNEEKTLEEKSTEWRLFLLLRPSAKKTLINEWIEKNPRAFDKTQKIMEHTRRKARAQKMTHE